MPVYLDVAARPDERSFKSAADKADRYFADASDRIGKRLSDGLSKGLKSSDDAVRKSAETAVKSYDKAADAAGRVVVEERKLQDLRSKGASDTALIVQSERLEKARRAEVSTTRAATSALRDFDAAQRVTGNGLSNFLGGVSQGASGTRLGDLASQAELLSTKLGGISAGGLAAAGGITAVVAGVGAASKALYDLGAQWDDIGDSMAARTGKVGDELKSMTDVVRRVGADTAAPLNQIGDVAGRVVQSLHLSKQPLEEMVRTVTRLNELTGEQTNIKDLGKAFRVFGVEDGGAQVDALNALYGAYQTTGVGVNELISAMATAGPVAKQLGLDFGKTAGLVTTLEEAGLDFTKAAPALTIALKNLHGDPDALRRTVTEIKNLADAGRDAQATDLAAKTFGKGYVTFLDAIKSGNLDVESLNESLKKTGSDIDSVYESTEDWSQSWDKLANKFSSVAEPAAKWFFDSVNTALEYSTFLLDHFLDAAASVGDLHLDALPGTAAGLPWAPGQQFQSGASQPATLGDLLTGANGVAAPGTPGSGIPLPTTNPSVLTPGMGPNFYKDWYPDQGTSGDKAKLPDAPVLPYDTSIPGWAAGLPASAQNSWMNAHNEVLSKQARLDQLKNAGASPDDIQQAANDLIKANQSLTAAEESLATARQSAYDKETKQLKGHAAAMNDIGAALDNDFGISKGLPGIAENIVRFVGNLALAGPLTMLNNIAQANPNEGSGLVGLLAANGAFGEKYTPSAIAASNAVVPVNVTNWNGMQAGLPPGFAGGAPSEAQVKQIASQFGLQVTSEDRPGDPGYHGKGMALDLSNGSGNTPQMRAYAEYMSNNFGPYLKELIYSDGSFSGQIGDGKNVSGTGYYSSGTLSEHQNHVHVAAAWGQAVAPLASAMQATASAMSASGFNWDAVAAKESSGNWANADTGRNGHYGGLQFSPSTWNAYGGQEFAPMPHLASPAQQKAIADRTAFTGYNGLAPQGLGAWEVITNGSTAGDGITVNSRPPVGGGTGMGVGPAGFMPQSMGIAASGVGFPLASGGAGVAAPAGQAYPAAGGGGFSGLGGMPMDALMMATSGLDAMAPGAGAAAKIGIQLANRAIGYAGQVAGIGVSGLLETLSVGDNPMGSFGKSWFGKLAGGFAGARPALPNMTGQQAPPNPNGQGGQQGQPQGNTTNQNVTINNQGATPDQNGKDVTAHLSAMAAIPGRQ